MSSQWRALIATLALLSACQSTVRVNREAQAASAGAVDAPMLVEAACGQCQFGLPGKGCQLAVRVEGQAYFVDGTGIDEHGDAHAADGLCNAVRRAQVRGSVVDGRFRARSLELLPKQ